MAAGAASSFTRINNGDANPLRAGNPRLKRLTVLFESSPGFLEQRRVAAVCNENHSFSTALEKPLCCTEDPGTCDFDAWVRWNERGRIPNSRSDVVQLDRRMLAPR